MNAKKKFLIFCLASALFFLIFYIIFLKPKAMQLKKANTESSLLRKPGFAGQFYPAEASKLKRTLDSFLKQAQTIPEPGKPQILIVPHAGLEFSGKVAGAGFKQLEGKAYFRVVLLGASHQAYFDSIAVFPQGSWETPLGKVEIDNHLAQALLDESQGIIPNSAVHEAEHSLEVELIFLQQVLEDFKIVPILIGQVSEEKLEVLAKKLAQNLDEETLLVVSSDLSHYPPYEIAQKVDRQTIKAILSGKLKEFEETLEEIEHQGYPQLVTSACGSLAIKTALLLAEKLGFQDFKEIKYENSGDLPAGRQGVSNDKNRVVGYAAIGIWSQEAKQKQFLDEQAQKETLKLARKTLEEHFSGKSPTPFSPQSSSLLQKLGAFVTLRKNGQLRGCIGEFEPQKPLYQVIEEMSIAAATKDSRFPPVKPEELAEIKIEISVMTPRRKIDDWQKIELGKHGVVIKAGNRAGTFLPQVAQETGWSKEEFLGQLCLQKLGLSLSCYENPEVIFYIFEVQIIEEK